MSDATVVCFSDKETLHIDFKLRLIENPYAYVYVYSPQDIETTLLTYRIIHLMIALIQQLVEVDQSYYYR